MQQAEAVSRWYQQPWMWVVLGLLATSVSATLLMVVISVIHRDDLVRDDWYKAGRAINQDLSASKRAAGLGLKASLALDPAQLKVRLDIQPSAALPAQLKLVLTHATLANEDMTTIVTRGSDGAWEGSLPRLPMGKRHISLEPVTMADDAERWRLRADDVVFQGSPLALLP